MAPRRKPTTEPPPPTPAQSPQSKAKRQRKTKSNGLSPHPLEGLSATATPIAGSSPTIIRDDVIDTTSEAPPAESATNPIQPPAGDDAPANAVEVAAAITNAARDGIENARELAAGMPPDAARAVVLEYFPPNWHTEALAEMLRTLDGEQVALLLALLSSQWWEGYRFGYEHAAKGHAPLTEEPLPASLSR